MSVASGAASLTVKEWAYNSHPDSFVRAGYTNATTRTAFLVPADKINILNTGKTVRFTNLDPGTKYAVTVAGISGQVIQKSMVSSADMIDLNYYPTGVYVIQLIADGCTRNFKIVVQ
jgi:hypothetical protein